MFVVCSLGLGFTGSRGRLCHLCQPRLRGPLRHDGFLVRCISFPIFITRTTCQKIQFVMTCQVNTANIANTANLAKAFGWA
jgi:hypothetical protein